MDSRKALIFLLTSIAAFQPTPIKSQVLVGSREIPCSDRSQINPATIVRIDDPKILKCIECSCIEGRATCGFTNRVCKDFPPTIMNQMSGVFSDVQERIGKDVVTSTKNVHSSTSSSIPKAATTTTSTSPSPITKPPTQAPQETSRYWKTFDPNKKFDETATEDDLMFTDLDAYNKDLWGPEGKEGYIREQFGDEYYEQWAATSKKPKIPDEKEIEPTEGEEQSDEDDETDTEADQQPTTRRKSTHEDHYRATTPMPPQMSPSKKEPSKPDTKAPSSSQEPKSSDKQQSGDRYDRTSRIKFKSLVSKAFADSPGNNIDRVPPWDLNAQASTSSRFPVNYIDHLITTSLYLCSLLVFYGVYIILKVVVYCIRQIFRRKPKLDRFADPKHAPYIISQTTRTTKSPTSFSDFNFDI